MGLRSKVAPVGCVILTLSCGGKVGPDDSSAGAGGGSSGSQDPIEDFGGYGPAVLGDEPGSDAPPDETLPTSTEVVLGPDARPSDYPEARGWTDTPKPNLNAPCCRLTSPAYRQTTAEDVGGPVEVAWNGSGWGVSWPSELQTMKFRPLAPDGTGAGSTVTVPLAGGIGHRLVWDNDRYLLASTTGWRATDVATAILNRSGYAPWGANQVKPVPDGAKGAGAARLTAERAWVVGVRNQAEGGDLVQVYLVDDHGAFPDDIGRTVAVGDPATVPRPALVGLKSRVAVAWGNQSGVFVRSHAWPPDDASDPVVRVFDIATGEDHRIALSAFRDDVAIVAVDSGTVWSAVVDPWEGNVISGPHAVGESDLFDYGADVVAASDGGFLGMCYSRGAEGNQSVVFRMLGPDGTAWTAEQTIAEGLRLAPRCSVAWSGTEFLVAWWYSTTSPELPGAVEVVKLAPGF